MNINQLRQSRGLASKLTLIGEGDCSTRDRALPTLGGKIGEKFDCGGEWNVVVYPLERGGELSKFGGADNDVRDLRVELLRGGLGLGDRAGDDSPPD